MEFVNDKPIYALKNGVAVNIEDVPSGLACECVCPLCQWPLVAKKGEIRAHHFAHHQKSSCGYDYLYSLYLFAEEVLKKADKIYLPDIQLFINGRFQKFVQKGYDVPITNVERIDGKNPQLIVYYKDKPLQIKLIKSTRMLNKFIKEMTEQKQPAIAIDISGINYNNIKEVLPELLIGDTYKKTWLYSSKAAIEEEKYKLEQKQRFLRGTGFVPESNFNRQINTRIIEENIINESLEDKLILGRVMEIKQQRASSRFTKEMRDPNFIYNEVLAEIREEKTEWARCFKQQIKLQAGK